MSGTQQKMIITFPLLLFSTSVVSNSLARLLCPWDFPGKNTGLGCHFLLQGNFMTQRLNPRLAGGFFFAEQPVKSTTEVNKSERQWVTEGLATVPPTPPHQPHLWGLKDLVSPNLCNPFVYTNGKLWFSPVVFQCPSMSPNSLRMCLRGSKGLSRWVIYFGYSISAFICFIRPLNKIC